MQRTIRLSGLATTAAFLAAAGMGVLAAATPGDAGAALPPDSAITRLESLQTILFSALNDLKEAPVEPQGGFVPAALADVNGALVEISAAMEFVRAHPESNALLARPVRAGWPVMAKPSNLVLMRGPKVTATYPTVRTAESSVSSGLQGFLIGDASHGYLIVGEIGGFRDRIFRRLSQADAEIIDGVAKLARAPGTAQLGTGVQPPASAVEKPGSISGRVLDKNGQPAPFVAVSFHLASEFPTRAPARGAAATTTPPRPTISQTPARGGFQNSVTYASGILATITDQSGAFVIHDLTPDTYIVVAEITNGAENQIASRPSIEVQVGGETKLVEPLKMVSRPGTMNLIRAN